MRAARSLAILETPHLYFIMPYLPHWPIPSTSGKRQIDYETVFERMGAVLEKLENPHQKLPPVIHVAGTNGKGSAVSLIAQIFSCAGYKTHIYTSPHLHQCNERIVLAGEKISDPFLFEVMEETRLAAGETPLTFMEAFTIGAFLAFSKQPADVLIIECGMGGRIDATNIIEKKIATVIMPISFDHTEYLGNSIERIALEKAMIMRPETPLIVASQPQKAREIIEILARDQNLGVPRNAGRDSCRVQKNLHVPRNAGRDSCRVQKNLHFYDEDFGIIFDEESGEFDFNFGKIFFENLPKPALVGAHQYINFSTAIATVLVLPQFKIEESHFRQAISTVHWPSRLERVENGLVRILKNPDSEIWIDGAHNEGGAFAIARWLVEKEFLDLEERRSFVIAGFSKNKCKKEFLEKFKNVAEIFAVRVNGEPYPEDSEVIVKIGAEIGAEISEADDLLDAIHRIAKICEDKPCRVIICGSLHLARDVRKFGVSQNGSKAYA